MKLLTDSRCHIDKILLKANSGAPNVCITIDLPESPGVDEAGEGDEQNGECGEEPHVVAVSRQVRLWSQSWRTAVFMHVAHL